MKTTLYSITLPIFAKHLNALTGLLNKAEEFAGGDASKLEALMNDKLYEDMFPFGKQVEVACDNAKGLAARLSGKEAPSYEDGDYSVDTLRTRLQNTIAYISTFTEHDFEGAEDREVLLKYFPNQPMSGFGYATEYAIPNFFFHAATAHGILRKNGIAIGKTDFITSLPFLES
jgi:hypothetical protein